MGRGHLYLLPAGGTQKQSVLAAVEQVEVAGLVHVADVAIFISFAVMGLQAVVMVVKAHYSKNGDYSMVLTAIGSECAENRMTTSSLFSSGNFSNSFWTCSAKHYTDRHTQNHAH